MELIQIDLHKILRSRIRGWKGKLIPGFLISGLERLIRQEELNRILRECYPAEGSAFAREVYNCLGLTIEVSGIENIPAGKRLLFASNHPLGGLDGIGLIKVLGDIYTDSQIRFMVNDMLMNVAPLRNVFLPINKYGSQARSTARAVNEAFAGEMQIVVFPAGLVSRLHDNGEIHDLQWQKSFVAKAIEYTRDIVPVRFIGLNRPRFYKLARLRKKLGIKVNLEQATLPAELCAARGRHYKVIFGKPISWESLGALQKPLAELAAGIRSEVYRLNPDSTDH